MPTVDVRNVQGEVRGHRALPEDLFGVEVKVSLMHQVVVAGAAAQRAGTHSTKTRGDVSGGGVKPWRQKGTGRARHGSNRSPIWAGGGVAHGPHPRDYTMRVNRKMKKAALRSALTDTVASGKIVVVEELAFDAPRTKDAIGLLRTLELEGKVLMVIEAPDEALEKSFRNLRNVKIDYPGNLSTFDLLYADRVLFTAAALDVLAGGAVETPATPVAQDAETPVQAEADTEPVAEAEDESEAAEEAGTE